MQALKANFNSHSAQATTHSKNLNSNKPSVDMSLPTSQSNERGDSISNVLPGNFMKVREKERLRCVCSLSTILLPALCSMVTIKPN